jgi:hypothetical protein
MRMRVCYLHSHESRLCYYLVIHIENVLHNYSCFTSIRDLFTDCPSYNEYANVVILFCTYVVRIFKIYVYQKHKSQNIQNYNFACGSVWVWNLVPDIKGGM